MEPVVSAAISTLSNRRLDVMPHEKQHMVSPSLSEVIAFVREFTGVRPHRLITAETRLDADLGVTGLDGDSLLRAAIERFRVDLASPKEGIAQTLGLAPNEYFFGPEGLDPLCITALVRWLRRDGVARIPSLSVWSSRSRRT